MPDPKASPTDDIPAAFHQPAGGRPIQSVEDETTQMIATLWLKSRSTMAERVAQLREACSTLQASEILPADQRSEVSSCAHKLAGVLGTFGFPQGTDAARKIENLMEAGQFPANAVEQLNHWIAELEEIVGSSPACSLP